MNNASFSFNRLVVSLALVLGGTPMIIAASEPATSNEAMVSQQPVTDSWITTKVKADLATTEGISSTDISVSTTNGVVTLIGVLASDTEVDKAIAVAKGIKGVVRVDASALKVK